MIDQLIGIMQVVILGVGLGVILMYLTNKFIYNSKLFSEKEEEKN